ncbi:uncharacterized protein SAPINGB_P004981 [Magnusiomyces paraingens]|uniref:enoyl-[acyl-carrier-protein] reductase n=1 Tax=Magnusiomyces paraingens TaxID=2606893 RepID=A0A5E8BXV6_9ASCO|nr:uncharacterized protein SAPINGB_P004981 [Saprochaete ingens]VVT56337.1 unnamed protein product [Saprochaete ingens]
MSVKSSAAVFVHTGDPQQVIQVESATLPAPAADEILLKNLAATLNPSDVGTVWGTYATIPPRSTLYTSEPSAIIGNEAIFEVVSVGKDVTSFKPGDWAFPSAKTSGTWCTHIVGKAIHFMPVPKISDPVLTSQAFINPTTAYQLLKTYLDLEKDDWVVQNGANSAVGRATIQLAREWGIKTLNIIRERPDVEDLKKELLALGATAVVTDKEIADPDFVKTALPKITGGGNVRLGLECVGGKSAQYVGSALSHGGTLVIYGCMSMTSPVLPASLFIFKDITTKGYWLATRLTSNPKLKAEALSTIFDLIKSGKLELNPVQKHIFKVNGTKEEQLKAVREAFTVQSRGFSNKKQVIVFE